MDVGDYGGVTGTRETLMRKTNLWKVMRQTLLTIDGRSPRVVRLEFASILPRIGHAHGIHEARPSLIDVDNAFPHRLWIAACSSVCFKLNSPLRFS